MNDWFFKQGGRHRFIDWLGIDSQINSALGETWSRIKDYWNAGSSYFARFQLIGWRRLLNEFASEGLTIGCSAASSFCYGLALPAFQEFDEGKFQTGKYAVKFLDVNGNEIGKRGILHNDAVPLDEIPDFLIKATLATEDRRFFEHYGIDVLGTFRALLTNLQANEVVQGGSTITQQLAKNLFLSSERSLQRKIKEAVPRLPAREPLLEARNPEALLRPRLHGRRRLRRRGGVTVLFRQVGAEINSPNPRCWRVSSKRRRNISPLVNLPASRARTNEVLDNLVEAGLLHGRPGAWGKRCIPARIIENRAPNSPDWFLDWAFEEVQRTCRGQRPIRSDGPHDRRSQRCSVRPTRRSTPRSDAMAGTIISTPAPSSLMETDGEVRAITGGPDYGESQFNRATHAKRQPGSSFKVYVYATALENGYTPDTVVRDASRSCGNWRRRTTAAAAVGGRACRCGWRSPNRSTPSPPNSPSPSGATRSSR